jgi:SnoaL-like polyketide cyclase
MCAARKAYISRFDAGNGCRTSRTRELTLLRVRARHPVKRRRVYVLSRRTAFAAAAFGAPATFALRPILAAEAGACGNDQSAANAILLARYIAAVNGTDSAARREIFAEPYIQHGGIKGLRDIFPDIHVSVEDRVFGGDKVVARNTWTGIHRGTLSRHRADRKAGNVQHDRHLAGRRQQICRALGRYRYCRAGETITRRVRSNSPKGQIDSPKPANRFGSKAVNL